MMASVTIQEKTLDSLLQDNSKIVAAKAQNISSLLFDFDISVVDGLGCNSSGLLSIGVEQSC